MNYSQWAKYGVDKGWATPSLCATHDGIPHTEAEDNEWEEGGDPCIHVIRLIEDPKDLDYIKRNNLNLNFG